MLSKEILAVVWVDTEDFITPESDDGALLIATAFEKHGIKVNFKLVGEEVRQLEERNRYDVIQAVSHHDVGFHSNLHSVHPNISEYIGELGWNEGALEWERKEYPGFVSVKQAFGRTPICYGHPGSSWVPQVYPVMKKWNIFVYLDDMETISSKNESPYYFCNILNLQGFGPNVMCLDSPPSSSNLSADHLEGLEQRLKKILKHLESKEGVPTIGMYLHPNSYSTEEFWDIVNFSRGKNPEGFISIENPGMMRRPKLKSTEKTRVHLALLERFLNFTKTIPHLHFITASDALRIYKDKSTYRSFSISEIRALCTSSIDSINYQIMGSIFLNAAEIYSLVLLSLEGYSKYEKLPDSLVALHPLGPIDVFEDKIGSNNLVSTAEFISSCVAELHQIRNTGVISASIKVGDLELSSVDAFATACTLYLSLAGSAVAPVMIEPVRGNYEVGNMVTEEGAIADWSYYFMPSNFRAPKQISLARLQCWTYKPAIADSTEIHPDP